MKRRTRLLVGVGTLAVVATAAWIASPSAVLSRLAWLSADPIRFAAFLVALALVRPLLAWPTTLIAIAAGYGYGVEGFPIALALITLTSVPPYLFARRTRGDGRFSTAGERIVRTAGDVRSVTASRLLPAPSDVVSIGAGVAGVRLLPYVLGTALGEIPWAIAGVLAGASLDSLGTGSLSAAFDPRLVAAAALAALLLLVGPARSVLSERGAEHSGEQN
jgi:uncharacterized membrane protein YdjX (TVP38/TMEM64 family)